VIGWGDFREIADSYYAWRLRETPTRRRNDHVLTQRIERIHWDSRKTYGAPRVNAELEAEGARVGRTRVARLMGASSSGRGEPAKVGSPHAPRSTCPTGTRPGRSEVRCERPESALGRRHDVHPDAGWLSLSHGRTGRRRGSVFTERSLRVCRKATRSASSWAVSLRSPTS
jgi:HTH-like domain